MVQQCVLDKSKGYWLLSNVLVAFISLVYQFRTNCLALDFNETQDFDGDFQFIE
jgi:hypothetical protein